MRNRFKVIIGILALTVLSTQLFASSDAHVLAECRQPYVLFVEQIRNEENNHYQTSNIMCVSDDPTAPILLKEQPYAAKPQLSSDNKHLLYYVSYGLFAKQEIHVWNLETGEDWLVHDNTYMDATWLNDDEIIYTTGSTEHRVRLIYDVNTKLHEITKFRGSIYYHYWFDEVSTDKFFVFDNRDDMNAYIINRDGEGHPVSWHSEQHSVTRQIYYDISLEEELSVYLTYIENVGLQIVLYDLSTEQHVVLKTGSWHVEQTYPFYSETMPIFSPSENYVVFMNFTDRDYWHYRYQLLVFDVASGEVLHDEIYHYTFFEQWVSEDELLLTKFTEDLNTTNFVSLNWRTGELTQLTDTETRKSTFR